MKITAEPRSDQWNADDFVQGPRTFTITGVKPGSAEQKYDITLEGSDRVWRPPLTVLRLLLAGWGDEASAWVGQRVTLFRDESVRFANNEGGIRVSHMTGITKPLRESLLEKRGSRKVFTVQPLTSSPAPTTAAISTEDAAEWLTLINAADTLEDLQRVWAGAVTAGVTKDAAIVAAKDARKLALT